MNRRTAVWTCLVGAIVSSQAFAGNVSTLAVVDANGGITLDSASDIYAANYGPANSTTGSRFVWELSPTGAFDPVIFASDINIGSGNDFDSQGNLFQANFGGNSISKIDVAGVVTNFSNAVSGPVGIAIDDADNLFVNNCHNNTITQLMPDGTSTVFVNSNLLNCPNGITRAANGDFYVINFRDGRIFHITPTGTITNFATIASPGGHVAIVGDRLYATSFGANQIFGLALSGANAGNVEVIIGTGVAGSGGGLYTAASFNHPNGITVDASGDILYVTDDTGVRKIELEDEAALPPPPPPPAPAPAPNGGGGGSFGFGFILCAMMFVFRRNRLLQKSAR